MTTLEDLRTRRDFIDQQIGALEEEIKPRQRSLSGLELRRAELERDIAALNRPVKVSDHAVLRYLERKHGFSFDRIRDEILTPDRAGAIWSGATRIHHEGVSFVVKDWTIVTVVD